MYHYVQRNGSATHSDYEINEKWLSAITAKEKVIKQLDKKNTYYKLYLAKAYNDLYPLVWNAYVSDDKKNLKNITLRIKPYKNDFFMSKEYSKKRKIKYIIIEALINLKIPKKIVKYVGNSTSFKIKNNIK